MEVLEGICQRVIAALELFDLNLLSLLLHNSRHQCQYTHQLEA